MQEADKNLVKSVRVTLTKEIKIYLTPKLFGPLSVDEYLKVFCQHFFEVESLDDVVIFAAEMAAQMGGGYEHDGLGLLDTQFSRKPPHVIFELLSEDCESEFIESDTAEV